MQSSANAYVSCVVKEHALLPVIRYVSFQIIVEYDDSNSITLELSVKLFEHVMLYFVKDLSFLHFFIFKCNIYNF